MPRPHANQLGEATARHGWRVHVHTLTGAGVLARCFAVHLHRFAVRGIRGAKILAVVPGAILKHNLARLRREHFKEHVLLAFVVLDVRTSSSDYNYAKEITGATGAHGGRVSASCVVVADMLVRGRQDWHGQVPWPRGVGARGLYGSAAGRFGTH